MDSSESARRPSSVRPPSSDSVSALTNEQTSGKSENANTNTIAQNQPEPVSVSADAAPALPNQCSYPGCGAPVHLVPQRCCNPGCGGKLHTVCRAFCPEAEKTNGKEDCYVCASGRAGDRENSPCSWPNYPHQRLSTNPCSGCGALVHRLCQGNPEKNNELPWHLPERVSKTRADAAKGRQRPISAHRR